MTQAKITDPLGYQCRPPEALAVMTFGFGEVVTGQVAEWAIADKAASRMLNPVQERKVVSPPEHKSRKKKDD